MTTVRPVDPPPATGVTGVLEAPPGLIPERPGRRAPWWLWVIGVAVLLPVAVPMLAMFARVLRASDSAWGTLFSARTLELAIRSAVLTATVTVTAVVVGVGAAWLTVRTDLKGRRIWGVLVAMPLVIPSYVLALVFLSASGPRGLIAEVTGIAVPVLSGLPGAWLALSLSTMPYVFLVTAAALNRLDPSLEEAARGLGGAGWRLFRTVTLPQLRPAVGAGALLAALYTLSDFGAVSLMRYDAFTRVIYAQYSGRLDRTPAAVLSVVLIVIALVIILAEERTRGRGAYHSRRPKRPPRQRRMSRAGKAAAITFLSVVVGIGVAAPLAVLFAWVGRGIAGGGAFGVAWNAVAGSITGSALAAVLAMAATIPLAVLAVRFPGRASRWLERSVYVTFSLPHIAVALAVVSFAVRSLGPLYQSLALLVMVYATIFLAQAVGATKAALLQVDPSLEEAARGLGRGPVRTLWDITIPLIWRGLLAGGALVFLTTMKELPVTLLLRPTGFDTLAVQIWTAADELLYARAATSALLLLAVSAVPMWFLVIRPKDAAR